MIPYYVLAEREGFEPPVPLGTPVFKTGTFDHSDISPDYLAIGFLVVKDLRLSLKAMQRYCYFFNLTNFRATFLCFSSKKGFFRGKIHIKTWDLRIFSVISTRLPVAMISDFRA